MSDTRIEEVEKVVKGLRCNGDGIPETENGCGDKTCLYRDPADDGCNIYDMCADAANLLDELMVENVAQNAYIAKMEAKFAQVTLKWKAALRDLELCQPCYVCANSTRNGGFCKAIGPCHYQWRDVCSENTER